MMTIDRTLFRTGVPLIDVQHEAYLDLVEQLFALCQRGDVPRATLESELGKVLSYAVEHFDTEEHLMLSLEYPYYAEHLAKHNVFRSHADEFVGELRSGLSTDALTIRLTTWLVEWIVEQIRVDDLKLATYLKTSTQHGLLGPAFRRTAAHQ